MGFSGITAIALCPWGLGPADTLLLPIRARGGVSRAAARWPGEDVRALPPQASGLVLCSLRWTPQLPAGLGRENEGQGQMSRERTCGQQGETRPAATWPSRGPSHQHWGALGSGLLPCTDGALRSQAQHCAGRHLLGAWFPPLGKMRPLPATASQGKSPVPP